MKTFQFKIATILIAVLTLSSCLNSNNDDIITDPITLGFDYKTIKEYKVSIMTLNNENLPFSNVQIKLYTQNPLNADGTLRADHENFLIYKGNTNEGGILSCQIAPATTVDSLSILVNQIGLPSLMTVKLNSSEINVQIGGNVSQSVKVKSDINNNNLVIPTPKKVSNFYVLGTWNSQGKPDYLEQTNDLISTAFLDDVNASLPERIKLPVSHPEYLTSEDDGSVVLIKDAEVWVTFVHEGAGFLNTLAYYTHPTNQPPATKNDIKDATVVFPNVSFNGSGGQLISGNKVQLFYLNTQTNTYTNIFPAGTTVSWILRSNGYGGGNTTTIANGYYNYYSDKRFNPELIESNRKHNVMLKDVQNERFLLGFEDLNREQGSDDDFNDAVFYTTVTPYSAVKNAIYQSIDSPRDADDDGVSDGSDDYPNDPKKAYNNYYPSKNQVGTLAFEDLWPYKGDYDFNDLVIDYNYNQITNSQNKTTAIEAQFTVRAIGASYKNGFGIEFNTTPENVISVSGQKFTENIVNVNSNGTEKNQSKAVVMAFDNAFSVTPHPGSGLHVNTVNGEPYQTPGIINLKIEFKNPIAYNEIGTAPYNPFIFINGVRENEVHLPGSAPTSLANLKLLGTGNDNSDISKGKYYMSDKYLPWAINFPAKFDYPAEKEDITKAYNDFNKWTSSNGFNYMDWYLNLSGYRNSSLIFTK